MNSNKKLLEALNEEKIDAVLISTPDDYNAQLFETWTIFSDSIYLAVPVTEADSLSTPVDLRHLQNKKFIALSEGFATGEDFRRPFRLLDLRPTLPSGYMIFFTDEYGECRHGLYLNSGADARPVQ